MFHENPSTQGLEEGEAMDMLKQRLEPCFIAFYEKANKVDPEEFPLSSPSINSCLISYVAGYIHALKDAEGLIKTCKNTN